ncbi:hypothetical protein [Rhizobium leguminosarum]|uniref:Uncharacterized protein n=1 Tax=Rhizobium leguminosarum TaxID=384 RepID=A0A2K9ZGI0_RHILE|nr:hypothetical protein [Rhizobium leguminosarum]AUW47329.1 conserved exported protein of unknown function [Rhizobium leguminosarum]
MRTVLFRLILILGTAFTAAATDAYAQLCKSAPQCRSTAPEGKLLHNPNSNGRRVWTTPCGPVTSSQHLDPICNEIAQCQGAGGFGKFLEAVTFQCRSKSFGGYFGLDGMTFGILDWTSSNLPGVLRAYQERSKSGFDEHFGFLEPQMKDGCLDPDWVCTANKNATLMCGTKFREAFSGAITTPDFRRAQMDYARLEYEARLARFSDLGLKTEYGNTAMAVLANNLLSNRACKPATWKAECRGAADEGKLVDCMLDQYVAHACRGGSKRTSQDRVDAIKKAFAGSKESVDVHPTSAAIEQCVSDWSK